MMQTMHAGGSTNPVRLTEFDLASGSLSTRIYAPATNQTWSEYAATFTGLTFV